MFSHSESYDLKSGWISPEGNFYPAPKRDHDSIAHRIMRYILKKKCHNSLFAREELIKRGWICIRENGFVYGPEDNTITKPQLSTINKMFPEPPDYAFTYEDRKVID